jgi:putative peptidoglycan lipid II flippase
VSTRRIARSAGLAGLATLTSRVLGLVRDQVLAALFGAGSQMDAFVVAFRIPNLVRDLFAEGALSASFVPTFTGHLTRHGKRDAWRLGNNMLNALALATGVLVAGGILFADPIVTLFAGDYAAVPGKFELTVFLTRLMLPFLTMTALAAVFMGMLNSLGHYFVPSLAPATFNVALIVGTIVLVPLMPGLGLPPIAAVAIAALVGGLTQVLFQLPHLRHEGFEYRPILDVRDPGLHRILLLMGPGALGVAATQFNLFVNTMLATGEGTGAVSWLAYAFRIMYLPIGLFGVSIATAVLPEAARHAALEDRAAIRDAVSRGLGLMMLMNVPATLGLVVLAEPIVRLLFERGEFLPRDTLATAAALQMYAIGLLGYSTARIVSPVFYALGRSRLAVTISAGSMGINVIASVLLVEWLGFRGLALGTAVAALAHGALALLVLRRHLAGINGGRLASRFVRILAAAIVMAAAAALTERWLASALPGESLALQAGRVAAAIAVGVLTLAAATKALRIPEIDDLGAAVRSRLFPPAGR